MKLNRHSYLHCSIMLLFYTGGSVMPAKKESSWNESYHSHSSFQYKAGKKAIDGLALSGNEKVLDVGSGTGRTTVYCAKKLGNDGSVIGLDYSRRMVNFASKEYKDVSNVRFIKCDAAEISYKDEFDVATSFFCLHWVKHQKKAVTGIIASLRDGGRALLYIPCANELSEHWYKAHSQVLDSYPEFKEQTAESFTIQSPSTWREWVTQAGGHSVEHTIIERTKVFASPYEMKQFLLALDIEPEMTKDQRDQFLDLIIATLYESYSLSMQDPFSYTTSTIALSFKK